MQRVVYCCMGVLLIVAAVYLSRQLVVNRDLFILAAVSPAIIAAAAYGLILLVRAFR